MFVGETITGAKGGHIACVSDGTTTYEIQPMGNPSHREFYAQHAAQYLADRHAEHLNAGKPPIFSFIKRS